MVFELFEGWERDDFLRKVIAANTPDVYYAVLKDSAAVKLQPRRPPGHAHRKALSFAAEIARLRSEGYSLVAIQEALQDAGVVVSLSTVWREVARAGKPTSASQYLDAANTVKRIAAAASPTPAGPASLPGKTTAEEFMRGQISNPLFRRSPPR